MYDNRVTYTKPVWPFPTHTYPVELSLLRLNWVGNHEGVCNGVEEEPKKDENPKKKTSREEDAIISEMFRLRPGSEAVSSGRGLPVSITGSREGHS